MKYVSLMIMSIVGVAMFASCRTTAPVDGGSASSGLSEVSVPLPEKIASKMDANGIAVMSERGGRQFESRILFKGGDSSEAAIKFDTDTNGGRITIPTTLNAVTLELRDRNGNAIYRSKAPQNISIVDVAGKEVTFALQCANSVEANKYCDVYDNIVLTGVTQQQGTTGRTGFVTAKITVDTNGSTLEEVKSKLVQCLQPLDTNPDCTPYLVSAGAAGQAECQRLLRDVKPNIGGKTLVEHVNSLTLKTDVTAFINSCRTLGVFQ